MSGHYKIYILDRNYENYEIYDSHTMTKLEEQPKINPITSKVMNGDIFEITKGSVSIIHSPMRKAKFISGVLVLKQNKTYGKFKNKYFYRCIPDDKRIPEFLIPYKVQMKFRKHQDNKYIVFKFISWRKKHPVGSIINTIGDVSELQSFYEYQMYCNSLYTSIANLKIKTKEMLKLHNVEYYTNEILKKYSIEDRLDYEIITIDSKASKDLDDALGVRHIDDENTIVSIYISNSMLWMDVLDLWESFDDRIATIYLPDRKRPMMPTKLSDDICSLLENKKRFAFTLDIHINRNTGEILSYDYCNTIICVRKNLRHKTDELNNNVIYNELIQISAKMNKKKIYLDSVVNSHEVVSYYMVLMNYLTAIKLKEHGSGIYRFTRSNKEYKAPDNASSDIKKFLKIWHSMGGLYCKFENIEEHDMLNLEAYLHITSPNRRLVDLLNIIIYQEIFNMVKLTEKSKMFYDKWNTNESIDYINKTMKSIRKVQNDCSLLNICYNDDSLTKKVINGYVFDKLKRNDNLYQYIVYIPLLKMTNRLVSTKELDILTNYNFKIFIFMDEVRLKQKIRLLLV